MIRRANDIEAAATALAQAAAMVHMTFGNAGETFRNMNDDLQENYLWALADRIEAAYAAVASLQEGGDE